MSTRRLIGTVLIVVGAYLIVRSLLARAGSKEKIPKTVYGGIWV